MTDLNMKKKRILLINHDSSLAGGGANDDFVRILKYLWNTNKYEIYCAFPEGKRVKEYSQYCTKFFIYTKVFFPVTFVNILHYYGFFKLFFKNYKEFKQILNESKFDIALLNVSVLIWPSIFLKRKKIKQLIFIRELILPTIFKKLVYKILKTTGDYFFTVSENLKEDFIKITRLSNIRTINSAIETDINEEIVAEEDLLSTLRNIKLDSYTFLTSKNLICMGSVNDRKNQILIINALGAIKLKNKEKVPNLYLAGDYTSDEKYLHQLKAAITKFGISDKVFFLGHLDKINLYKLLSRMDALIISSKSEGLPLVLVEALKFKIPVLTTNVGGIKDIIVDQYNGIIINGKVESLVRSLSKLDDSILIEKIIQNGYKTFKEKFNLEKNLKLIEQSIDALIKK